MPSLVSEHYPELMHYTTSKGLEGIISSGCLWATDAKHLNDTSEITHFFNVRLKKVIAGVVRARFIDFAQSPDNLAQIVIDGGFDELVDKDTNKLVEIIKNSTLLMNRPFVLSLCGTSDSRIAQSGLLSQWRGYGKDGGFAIVFDTAGIENALLLEAKQHHYTYLQMGDLFYEGIDPDLQPSTADFNKLEEVVRRGVDRLLLGGKKEEFECLYEPITSLSCFCKHWGFFEEREVRVVVIPQEKDQLDDDTRSERFPKKIKSFKRDTGIVQVPYLELFKKEQPSSSISLLPIKRIIVGPHPDSCNRVDEVKELLSKYGYKNATVQRSEIPYLGQ